MMETVSKSPEKHDHPSPGDAEALPVKDKGASKAKGQGQGQGHGQGQAKGGREEQKAPQNIIGPRINLALPFAKIEVQEPSADLAELASLLSDLVSAVADWVPEESLADFRSRAEALSTRLGT